LHQQAPPAAAYQGLCSKARRRSTWAGSAAVSLAHGWVAQLRLLRPWRLPQPRIMQISWLMLRVLLSSRTGDACRARGV
jgi:hypothetical protein